MMNIVPYPELWLAFENDGCNMTTTPMSLSLAHYSRHFNIPVGSCMKMLAKIFFHTIKDTQVSLLTDTSGLYP